MPECNIRLCYNGSLLGCDGRRAVQNDNIVTMAMMARRIVSLVVVTVVVTVVVLWLFLAVLGCSWLFLVALASPPALALAHHLA